jgi:Fe-S-cluster containining protein
MVHKTSSILFKAAEETRQVDFLDFCKHCLGTYCCVEARPPISSKRKSIVEDYLKGNGAPVENAFEEKNSYQSPREVEGNKCCFLDSVTKKCLVHKVKPETCVAGPITFNINPQTGKIEWFLKTEKICPLAGALFNNRVEFQRHLASAKRELLTLVHDLDPEALQAILTIEESDTFKIGEDDLDAEALSKLKPNAKTDTIKQ